MIQSIIPSYLKPTNNSKMMIGISELINNNRIMVFNKRVTSNRDFVSSRVLMIQ